MSWLRLSLRLARAIVHVFAGLWIVAFLFPPADWAGRAGYTRRWSARLLRIFGVRLKVTGAPPDAAALYLLNHISWLDIFVFNSAAPARFVAKAEVQRWPLLGKLAALGGSLFVERARRHDVARIGREITESLAAGEPVALFPEGTTTDGSRLLPFRASLLQPAAQAGVPVVAVAVRYVLPGGARDAAPAFVDGVSFLDTVLNIARRRATFAELVFAPPLMAAGRDRRELARAAQRQVAEALGLEAPEPEGDTTLGGPETREGVMTPDAGRHGAGGGASHAGRGRVTAVSAEPAPAEARRHGERTPGD